MTATRIDINPANGDVPHMATQPTIHAAWTRTDQHKTTDGTRKRFRSITVRQIDAQARSDRARALATVKRRRDNARLYRSLARQARMGDPGRKLPAHIPLKLMAKTSIWRMAAESESSITDPRD